MSQGATSLLRDVDAIQGDSVDLTVSLFVCAYGEEQSGGLGVVRHDHRISAIPPYSARSCDAHIGPWADCTQLRRNPRTHACCGMPRQTYGIAKAHRRAHDELTQCDENMNVIFGEASWTTDQRQTVRH